MGDISTTSTYNLISHANNLDDYNDEDKVRTDIINDINHDTMSETNSSMKSETNNMIKNINLTTYKIASSKLHGSLGLPSRTRS